jgi:hypothetical protein
MMGVWSVTLQWIGLPEIPKIRMFFSVLCICMCLYECGSLFNAKRLLWKFDDPAVQHDIKRFPFTVFNKGGEPYIKVEYLDEEKEVVSLLLRFYASLLGMGLM